MCGQEITPSASPRGPASIAAFSVSENLLCLNATLGISWPRLASGFDLPQNVLSQEREIILEGPHPSSQTIT